MGHAERWWRIDFHDHSEWTADGENALDAQEHYDYPVVGPFVLEARQPPGIVEALRRIAAGHAHPSKLAGEALDALPPDDRLYDPPYFERGQ
jgi:hypothetical protein